jgi:hypothetical protein
LKKETQMDDFTYTAAQRLDELEMREVIDRVFTKGSLIGVILAVQETDHSGYFDKPDEVPEGEATPCTFDVVLSRGPSKEELRALGQALGFSAAQLLEPYEQLVDRIRYQAHISFVIVTRYGGVHWLNGQPVETALVLDFVAAHLEKVTAKVRKRAENAKARLAELDVKLAAAGGAR